MSDDETETSDGDVEELVLFAQNEDGELFEVGILEFQDDQILCVTLTDHRAQGTTFIRSR